jgi:cell division protein FtsB
MNKLKKLVIRLDVLNEEIELIESLIEPQDCGHLKTTVSVLKERMKKLKEQIYDWKDE